MGIAWIDLGDLHADRRVVRTGTVGFDLGDLAVVDEHGDAGDAGDAAVLARFSSTCSSVTAFTAPLRDLLGRGLRVSSSPPPASILGALSIPATSGTSRYLASSCLTASARLCPAVAGPGGDDRATPKAACKRRRTMGRPNAIGASEAPFVSILSRKDDVARALGRGATWTRSSREAAHAASRMVC